MAAGRPTVYDESRVEQVKEYLLLPVEKYEVKTRPVVRTHYMDGKTFQDVEQEEYVQKEINLPSIEGLAHFMALHKDTLYEWEKKYPEFSDVMSELRSYQAKLLINNTLSGDYEKTISKLLLVKHGYRDSIENTGKDGGPIAHTLTPEAKNELINLLDDKQTSTS